MDLKATICGKPEVIIRKRSGKNPLTKFVKVGAHAGDLMESMLKTGKTLSTDIRYKPSPKKGASRRGKVIPFKVKFCEKKRPVAKRGKKKSTTVNFIDFRAELENSSEQKRKSKIGKQKRKSTTVRTELTLRTLKNWSEPKVVFPEKLIVNTNYTDGLVLREDYGVNEMVFEDDKSELSEDINNSDEEGDFTDTDDEDDKSWEDIEVEVTYGDISRFEKEDTEDVTQTHSPV